MKYERNWGQLGMRYKTYTMEDALEAIIDYRGKTPKKSEKGIPTLSAKSVKNNHIDYDSCYYISSDEYKRFMVRGLPQIGDVLLTTEAPLGMVAQLDRNDVGIAQRLLTLRGKQGILDNEYLLYYLQSPIGQALLRARETGTTVTGIKQSEFRKIQIDIPDIENQRKIGGILRGLDDKIAVNNSINKNLEQQAQAIFKSWFVDFEPFNGAMPSDWEIVPLEKIVSFQNGYAFKSKELLNEPSSDCYQVFKQGHIARGGGFIPDGTKSWFPKSLASKLERFVLKKGDILMAMTDMKDNVAILGNTAVIPRDNEYIVNQRVGHLRANGYKGITYPFVYLLTNSTDFLVDLRSRANSGVQVNLSSAEIKTSQTVLPTEKVNIAFSEITLPMFEIIINNQLENQRLTQLRDTLLPKLMSGELDVSDIDL